MVNSVSRINIYYLRIIYESMQDHHYTQLYQTILENNPTLSQGRGPNFGTSGGVAVGRRQAVDWQRRSGHYFRRYFLFFSLPLPLFSVATFSHRQSARIKKLIQQKLTGAPNNLGLDPFPDPVGHFGAPWRPFWISRPLIGRNTRSAQIKKLIQQKLTGAPNNLGLDPFPDPVGHFWAPWRPFWISRPLIGRNTDCSDQKTYLAKVVRSTHIIIEK